MKYIIAIAIALSLNGCFYQTIDSGDIKQAQSICKDRGGIHSITEHFDKKTRVECLDGYQE